MGAYQDSRNFDELRTPSWTADSSTSTKGVPSEEEKSIAGVPPSSISPRNWYR